MPPDEVMLAKYRELQLLLKRLNLIGVMLLAPPCPICGKAHDGDFELLTNLRDPDDIRELLVEFAELAKGKPIELPLGPPS